MVYAKSLTNPSGRQSSSGFDEGKGVIQENFDYVLDTRPLELVSDTAILATHSNGVLLVMDAQDTRKRPLRNTMHNLETVGANVLDTVINNAKVGKHSYYGYRYE